MKAASHFGIVFGLALAFLLGATAAVDAASIVTYGSANTVNSMAVSGDWLWCATEGGVVRWNTKDLTHRVFTVADGLADNSVQCIAAGRDGVVWAGTKFGACRYDGNTWKTFTGKDGLYSDEVASVAVDSRGVAWFGTMGRGLSRYADGVWTTFPDTVAQIVVVDNSDNLWCTSWQYGISRYDGKTWTVFSEQKFQYRSNLSVSPDGVVWVVSDNEINWYADGKWNTSSGGRNTPVAGAKNGACWTLYGPETGVVRFDSQTGTSRTVPFPDEYPLVVLYSMTVGQDDVAWFGSRIGVLRYDGAQWTMLRVTESLAGNYVPSLSAWPGGMLWAATEGGVSSFDGTQWRTYTHADGLAGNNIVSVAAGPGKTAWVATYNSRKAAFSGLSRFDGTKWETFDPSAVLPNNRIMSLAVGPDETLWVATEREITRYDGTQWTVIPSPESSYIYSLKVDPSGVVWICTEFRGVFKRENGAWVSVPFDQNYHGDAPKSMEFGKECIYFSNGYIYKYAGSQWKGIGGDDDYRALAVGPYDEPWIGGWDGVKIYNGFSWNKHKVCERVVGSIASDGRDGIWIGTWFEGVKRMTAPPGIHGKVSSQDAEQGIPGVAVIITPGDYVLYTDERGEFRIPDMPPGVYTLKARVKAPGNSGYLDVVREGVAVSANDGAEVSLVFPGSAGVADQPAAFRVDAPYPNPFNPATSIAFTLPAAERVSLTVYDITGRKIRDIIDGPLSAGSHTVVWDGRDGKGREVSSGVYIARLAAGSGVVSRRMTLLR